MKLARRIGLAIAVVVALWLVALLIIGLAYGETYGQRVTDRMAEALKATGTLADSDLALVRGRLELEQLRVAREDDIGKLGLDVAAVRCELPPLGLALVDRDCSELAIRGVRLEATSFELFKVQRPRRAPIRAESVVIEDAVIVYNGLPRIEIKVARVVAGPTTFKTPLSWIFTLVELQATVDSPFGAGIEVTYANGVLAIRGGLIGTKTFPVALPTPDAADEPRREIARLVEWAKQVIVGQVIDPRLLGR